MVFVLHWLPFSCGNRSQILLLWWHTVVFHPVDFEFFLGLCNLREMSLFSPSLFPSIPSLFHCISLSLSFPHCGIVVALLHNLRCLCWARHPLRHSMLLNQIDSSNILFKPTKKSLDLSLESQVAAMCDTGRRMREKEERRVGKSRWK